MLRGRKDAFLCGASRTLDIGATLSRYVIPLAPVRTEVEALRGDWVNVGNYLRESMEGYDSGEKETVAAE